MSTLKVKNWDRFQHYRDRCPPWIKLATDTFQNYEFSELNDTSKLLLICIWTLAAKTEQGEVPDDLEYIRGVGRLSAKVVRSHLDELVESGFLVSGEASNEPGRADDWGSRYVSKDTRERIMARDSRRCRNCKSEEHLEIDHVIPISRGGDGEDSNLQVLCRSCNRSKRTRITAEQVATQKNNLRSSEAETEGETEERREGSCGEVEPPVPPPTLLVFPVVPGKKGAASEWGFTQAHLDLLTSGFPNLDVMGETSKARVWAVANPANRKTAGGMPAFLSRWMAKAQNGQASKPQWILDREARERSIAQGESNRRLAASEAAKRKAGEQTLCGFHMYSGEDKRFTASDCNRRCPRYEPVAIGGAS